jgi:hypothetical protein
MQEKVANHLYKKDLKGDFLENQNWVLEFSLLMDIPKTNDSAFKISG